MKKRLPTGALSLRASTARTRTRHWPTAKREQKTTSQRGFRAGPSRATTKTKTASGAHIPSQT